jgi:hypothetical protein
MRDEKLDREMQEQKRKAKVSLKAEQDAKDLALKHKIENRVKDDQKRRKLREIQETIQQRRLSREQFKAKTDQQYRMVKQHLPKYVTLEASYHAAVEMPELEARK